MRQGSYSDEPVCVDSENRGNAHERALVDSESREYDAPRPSSRRRRHEQGRRVRRHRHRVRHGRDDDGDRAVPNGPQGPAPRAGAERRRADAQRSPGKGSPGTSAFTTAVRSVGISRAEGCSTGSAGARVEFRSVGTVYDTLHFPDGFYLPVGRPAEAFKMELRDRFPGHAKEVEAYFEALQSGRVGRASRDQRASDARAVPLRAPLVEQVEDPALVWSHDR